MIKVYVYLFFMSLLTLSGCTDNGVLFRSSGYDIQKETGIYKIGQPYQIKGVTYTPQEDYSYSESGMASWYVGDSNHSITANGEKYDPNLMTAMHKTLPLPSLVRITNLENNNTAIVRVNDRGPFVNNRLMDVSQKTAEALEFTLTGTTMIRVDILPEESRRMKEELLRQNKVDTSDSQPNIPLNFNADLSQPLYAPGVSHQILYDGETTDLGEPVVLEEELKPIDLTKETQNVSTDRKDVGVNGETSAPNLQVLENPVIKNDIDTLKKNISQPISEVKLNDNPTSVTSSLSSAEQLIESAQKISSRSDKIKDDITEEKISKPVFYIQAGAFTNLQNADLFSKELGSYGKVDIYPKQIGSRNFHRVLIGPFETRADANQTLDKLNREGYSDFKIILEEKEKNDE